jgi:hypothetical protein
MKSTSPAEGLLGRCRRRALFGAAAFVAGLGCGEQPAAHSGGDAAVPPGQPDAGAHSVVIDIAPGAIINGEQTTRVRSTAPVGALRVDLFLDAQRVGTAELAPFDVKWSTANFADGVYELRARAYLGDDTTTDAVVSIRIDNTPPTFGSLPGSMARGTMIDLPVQDNVGVARVHIGSTTIEAPFRFEWDAPCGSSSVLVRVVDLGGLEWRSYVSVETNDPKDRDCDGFLSVDAGGMDCDDANPGIRPDAPDYGYDDGDRNCDGMPGVDADRDGVATVETGGDDCDDASANVHGAQIRWRSLGVSVPEIPSIVFYESSFLRATLGGADVHIVTWQNGALEHVALKLDGAPGVVRRIAPRAALAAITRQGGELVVAYSPGAGDTLRVARWSGGTWVSEQVNDQRRYALRDLRIAAVSDRLDVLYMDHGDYVYASRHVEGAWTTRLLARLANSPDRIEEYARDQKLLAWGPSTIYRIGYSGAEPDVERFDVPCFGGCVAAMLQGEALFYGLDQLGYLSIHGLSGDELGRIFDGWLEALKLPH